MAASLRSISVDFFFLLRIFPSWPWIRIYIIDHLSRITIADVRCRQFTTKYIIEHSSQFRSILVLGSIKSYMFLSERNIYHR